MEWLKVRDTQPTVLMLGNQRSGADGRATITLPTDRSHPDGEPTLSNFRVERVEFEREEPSSIAGVRQLTDQTESLMMWYQIEIDKLLMIFAHASRNFECIVSML